MTERDDAIAPLHDIERSILMILLEEESHAYGIMAELERRLPGRRFYAANLYRRLNDMVDAGLLEELPVPAGADTRRRCHYRVTPRGKRAARREAERLARVVEDAWRLGLLGSR